MMLRMPAREHLAFALVLAVALAGFVRIAQYNWREGATVLGGALLLAGVLRALLPPDRTGLLAIRGRALDVFTYGALGLLIVVTAVTIA